jgi:hypothetical protein
MTPPIIPLATEALILRQMKAGASFTAACADANFPLIDGLNLLMRDPVWRAQVYALLLK